MDDLLPKLLAFPPHPPPLKPISDHQYDEGIREQIDMCKKISESKFLQQTSGGEQVMDVSTTAPIYKMFGADLTRGYQPQPQHRPICLHSSCQYKRFGEGKQSCQSGHDMGQTDWISLII
jgi:hypothetical protein